MKRALAAVAALALSVLAAACGGVEREPNLREAAERTQATGTVKMEMSFLLKEDDTGDISWRCEGALDFARERFRAFCASPDVGPDAEDYEVRELEGTLYTRGGGLEGEKPWTRFPIGKDDESSFAELSPERLFELLTRASLKTERVGEERVRDEETVRYAVTVDCEAAASEFSCSGETGVVDVWLDDDGVVRRVRLDEAGMIYAVEFFDFGEPVDIEAPPPDEVQDFKDVFPPRCSGEDGAPITTEQALGALRRHGFDAKRAPYGCGGGVAAVLSNLPDDALESHQALGHGLLTCHVLTGGEGHAFVIQGGFGAPDTRQVDRDLENVQCSLVVEDARAEPAIDRLDAAFAELKRAVRP